MSHHPDEGAAPRHPGTHRYEQLLADRRVRAYGDVPDGNPFYAGRLQLVDENGTPQPVTFAQVAMMQADEIIKGHILMQDRFTLLEQRVARISDLLDRCIQDDGKSVGIGIGIGMTLLTESANRCTNVAATTAYSAH